MVISFVNAVRVEADGDALVVRWNTEDPDATIDVASGPTPDAADHVHVTTVAAGLGEARVPRAVHERCYVSLTPHGGSPPSPSGAVVAAERRVPFGAVTNFRDLGGYPTTDGGHTRWGRVFRADGLHRLDPSEMALYRALGVRVVYDLRQDDERARSPDPVESVPLPLLAGDPRIRDEADAEGPRDAAAGERFLQKVYRGLLMYAGPLFAQLFEGLAAPHGLPAVFHCTGGKDRTGMSAALLLELLGVPRDLVLDDYTLTAQFRRPEHQQGSYERMLDSGMPPEAAAAVLGAPRWAMSETLRQLDDDYGGIEHYLLGPGGLSARTIDRLRSRLVE